MKADTPEFWYFSSVPPDAVRRDGVASSLQGVETSILLVSESRYPHALLSLVTAAEGALKAAAGLPADDRTGFAKLLADLLRGDSVGAAPPCPVSPEELSELRDLRNRVAHRGYSPRDNAACASLLLTAGYPFVSWLYTVGFGFDLLRGLDVDVGRHLRIALHVLPRLERDGAKPEDAFIALGHLVRWHARQARASAWEREVSVSPAFEAERWRHLDEATEVRLRTTEPSWALDCPVCDEGDSLVCGLDLDALASGAPGPLGDALCTSCGLLVTHRARALTNELCAGEAADRAPEILAAYGHARPNDG